MANSFHFEQGIDFSNSFQDIYRDYRKLFNTLILTVIFSRRDPLKLDNSRILVIGGAGFVGSHIVDQLIREPVSEIIILDNFVRGTHDNIEQAKKDSRVKVVEGSITDIDLLNRVMENTDYVLLPVWQPSM